MAGGPPLSLPRNTSVSTEGLVVYRAGGNTYRREPHLLCAHRGLCYPDALPGLPLPSGSAAWTKGMEVTSYIFPNLRFSSEEDISYALQAWVQ